jgi:hypothetical protein
VLFPHGGFEVLNGCLETLTADKMDEVFFVYELDTANALATEAASSELLVDHLELDCVVPSFHVFSSK